MVVEIVFYPDHIYSPHAARNTCSRLLPGHIPVQEMLGCFIKADHISTSSTQYQTAFQSGILHFASYLSVYNY